MPARHSLSHQVAGYWWAPRPVLARWFLPIGEGRRTSAYQVLGAPMPNSCNARRSRGFTLVEVMVAVAIMATGLMAVAALMAQLMGSTNSSRYMSTEVTLATEKLEFLNQLQAGDPILTPGGSLANDIGPVIGSDGLTNVWYFDQVQVSSTNGQVVDDNVGGAPAAGGSDLQTFSRRWTIESPVACATPPCPNVVRLTVLITHLTGC